MSTPDSNPPAAETSEAATVTAPAPAPAPGIGEVIYAAYFKAAAGKNHRGEPLPASYADLTEDRQAVWDALAAAF